jgi:hypothetical protein
MHAPGRVAVAVLGIFAAWTVAGCELFLPGTFTPDGQLQEPSPRATYTKGSATLAMGDGTKVTLDRLSEGPHLIALYGSSIRWSNADGWSLQLTGAGASSELGNLLGSGGYLQLDRIVGVEHWQTYETGRCIVDIDVANETSLKGSATCMGLEWSDALVAPFPGDPKEIDQPAFDAEITFEATR